MRVTVCNKDGYIQGMQIRLDVDDDRYRWFSTNEYPEGTGVSSWVHVVGNTSSDTAYLTEGALKADVTSTLSGGELFIAIPGVNAVTCLADTLRRLKLKKVYEAFDIDNSKAELYMGAYGAAKADIKLNTTAITQFMIDAPSKTSFETDIKDIKIRTVETYDFPDVESYNVTLVLNGGTINSGNVTSYTYGTVVTLPTDVTRDNYTFDGWYDNSECTGEAVTAISATDVGDKTYYAKWKQNVITEYLDVLNAFKDKMTIEKVTDETGEALVVTPKNNEILSQLTLYSAIYNADKSLKSVTTVKGNVSETGYIRIPLSELQLENGESYKLMLWTDNYAPVIKAITNETVDFLE